jgi:hypothetical protein
MTSGKKKGNQSIWENVFFLVFLITSEFLFFFFLGILFWFPLGRVACCRTSLSFSYLSKLETEDKGQQRQKEGKRRGGVSVCRVLV